MVAIISTQSGGSAGTGAPVIDSANSSSTTAALSANQGRIIRQDLDAARATLQATADALATAKGTLAPHVVTPTAGQTTFTLPSTPTVPGSVIMYVNHIAYAQATGDLVLSGANVTWNNDPPLTADDEVFFTYV